MAQPLIFLDEPTTGLDSFQAQKVVQSLRTLAGCYALSALCPYPFAMRRPVLDLAVSCYAVPARASVLTRAIVLHASYALSGTDGVCAATRRGADRRVRDPPAQRRRSHTIRCPAPKFMVLYAGWPARDTVRAVCPRAPAVPTLAAVALWPLMAAMPPFMAA
eukprot:3589660-Rhodomonas_salina.1